MRTRSGPVLLGMALLVCLAMTCCSRRATPTVAAMGDPAATPTATLQTATAILTAEPTLRDDTAPVVTLNEAPDVVQASEGLKVVARASDDVGVERMALSLDGTLLYDVPEASLRYPLDTRSLSAGAHLVVVSAWDAAGNEGRAELAFTLIVPSPTLTITLAVSADPTVAATPWVSPTTTSSPTAAPTAAPTPATVAAWWDEINIPTYGYQEALYTDPEAAGHPYPLLRRDLVTGPTDYTYRRLVMRNDWLEVQVLPELGGRIYQLRFLPTGQDLLYTNQTIKPTHWGPPDQGWWLAVGGIEFCLPVDEHGYVTAEPWDVDLVRGADGSATAVVSIVERTRNLNAEVRVTLRPGEAGIRLRTSITNLDAGAKSFQYWINAMLSPGAHGVQPSLRFYYPTDAVIVHSRGDGALPDAGNTLPWPVYDGRDLSSWATWRNWLGFFAPSLSEPYTAVYDTAARIGLLRSFDPHVAPGAKLFGFGQGFDPSVYTDGGSQYVEMWGGLTPTFWDYATLAGHERREWDEFWYVLAGLDGLTTANERAVLSLSRDAGGLVLSVASPSANDWTLSVWQGDSEIGRWACAVRPGAPCSARLKENAWNATAGVDVRIVDGAGQIVLAYDG